MAKKFTIKKHRLRARAKRRTWALKTNPQVTGLKPSTEQLNLETIRSLEAKVAAVQNS